MSISRRHVLLQGFVFGAGVIAENMSGMEALAQGQPPVRRTLQGLAWNDPIVATYRDAVGIMKQKPTSDKLSWVSLTNIHGTDPNTYQFCPHGNWYFLPWHRAYILMYERTIRYLTSNNSFALPYWDWTANPTMPQVFLKPTTPDGKKNWLFVNDNAFDQNWKRIWPPNKPMPPDEVGPSVLQAILQAPDYESFGTTRPNQPGNMQNNLDPSWIVDQNSGEQGVLEGLAHNMVHNNIGGWMPSACSPRDPIFFMHHCNIDRIWALWNSLGNQNSPDPLWNDMPFTNNFFNTDGTFYSPKVSDLYVPEQLGYTYGLGTQMSFTSSPTVMALQSGLETLRRAPGVANTANVRTFTAAAPPQAAATATKPLSIPVPVDANLVAQVIKRNPVSSGLESLNFSAARDQRASGTRAIAFIRNVAVTQARDTQYRIFLDGPGVNAQTPVTDPHYVGSFGVIQHAGHGGKHNNPSFAVDLTSAMQRVFANAPPANGRVTLQILPVSNRPNAKQVGTAKPARVEVAFVTS